VNFLNGMVCSAALSLLLFTSHAKAERIELSPYVNRFIKLKLNFCNTFKVVYVYKMYNEVLNISGWQTLNLLSFSAQ